MDKIIIIRYGEIHLKGKNRRFFENLLIKDIKEKLLGVRCNFYFGRGRYTVENYDDGDESIIIDRLGRVFGLHSVSIGSLCHADIDSIISAAVIKAPKEGTFKVKTNRADKSFPISSLRVNEIVGEAVLNGCKQLSVDVHRPDTVIEIDIRENGKCYIFSGKIACLGGMPLNSAGKGIAMMSGGIDSPVAAFLTAKRGLKLDMVHFYSYPYTSEAAKQKVVDLAERLSVYMGKTKLYVVPFTKIQEAIKEHCDTSYMITLVRRFMMKITERLAVRCNCGCIVNGESLGQVASQTLASITVTNDAVKNLPVFRPLIASDKQEIIELSKKIETYEISILPYEDCCTVFLPESPVTKPSLSRTEFEENKIPDYDGLIENAMENIETVSIG